MVKRAKMSVQGMIGASINNFGVENERFSDAAIAEERAEQKKIDETKYKVSIETKIPGGVVPAGSVATGETWRKIAGINAGRTSIAPAIFDRLQQVSDKEKVTVTA